jgi:zinc protease
LTSRWLGRFWFLLWLGGSAGGACGSPATITSTSPAHLPATAPVGGQDRLEESQAVVDGDVVVLRAAGVPVIVKRVPTAEVVTSVLFIRGGASNCASQDAGIEDVALSIVSSAARGETRARKNVGIEFGSSVWEDHAELFARGPTSQWQPALEGMLTSLSRGAVSQAALEVARRARLQELRAESSDLQEQLARLARDAFFKGHAYAINPIGTPETLGRLSAEAVGAHLAKLRERSRYLVVVVGNVDAHAVAAALRPQLEPVPLGHFIASSTVRPTFSKPSLSLTPRESPLALLCGVFAAPLWQEAPFAAGLVATEALDAAIFQELRSRRGLSYFQYARLGTGWAFPAGRVVVASNRLGEAFTLVRAEMDRLKTTPLSERSLRGAQQTALMKFYQERQTTDDMAFTLGRVQLRTGDWRWSRIDGRIRSVTATQVQEFARRYLVNLQTTVLAPAETKLDPEAFAAASPSIPDQ